MSYYVTKEMVKSLSGTLNPVIHMCLGCLAIHLNLGYRLLQLLRFLSTLPTFHQQLDAEKPDKTWIIS